MGCHSTKQCILDSPVPLKVCYRAGLIHPHQIAGQKSHTLAIELASANRTGVLAGTHLRTSMLQAWVSEGVLGEQGKEERRKHGKHSSRA